MPADKLAEDVANGMRHAEGKGTLCTIDEVFCNVCGRILQRSYTGGDKATIYGCYEHDPSGKYEIGVSGLYFSPRVKKIEGGKCQVTATS